MPKTLTEAIKQLRIRGGAFSKSNSNEYDPTGNAQLALYLNEAQEYWAKEAINSSSDPDKINNSGWFLKVASLTPVGGSVWLPPDVELLIGETSETATYDQLARQNCIRPISASGGIAFRGGDRLVYPASSTGTKHIVYNSNLKNMWVSCTVTSATSTTVVVSATPIYSTVPVEEEFDDYYVGLRFKVTTADGTQSQIVRPTAYVASTRTFSVSSWPSFTPSSGDKWESLNRLEHDSLLIYDAMQSFPQAARESSYKERFQIEQMAFYSSIQLRHGYTH